MTYWINVWHSSQPRLKAGPYVQHWNTELDAIEEIADGPVNYFYDETIKVDGKIATVIDLEGAGRSYARAACDEHMDDMAQSPARGPL